MINGGLARNDLLAGAMITFHLLLMVLQMLFIFSFTAHLRRAPASPALHALVHIFLDDLVDLTLHVAEALAEVLLLQRSQLSTLLHFLLWRSR